MAKRAREQAVKEKRERKNERKQAAAAARLAGDVLPTVDVAGEPGDDDDASGESAEPETALNEVPSSDPVAAE